jgi:hypothetical protein
MKLPINTFKSVEEIFEHDDSVGLVCLDHKAGRPERYSAIRLMLKTGTAFHLGRELPFEHAKRLASRASSEDGRKKGW